MFSACSPRRLFNEPRSSGPNRRLRQLAALVAVAAGSSSALGQGNLVQIPPHNNVYTGYSRGYSFTANTPFVLARLEVPPDAMQPGDTATVVLRVNGTVAHYSAGNVSGYSDPMVLINQGDVVDVVGNWSPASTGNFTARNSYAVAGVINTTIEGVAHELYRVGVQWDISDPGWETASWIGPNTGQPGRIFMYTLPPTTDPGGCCFTDGSCQMLAPLDCANQGGTFRGPNTDCSQPCPQPGACCFPDGSCDELLEADCDGNWQGANSECATANCPQPATGACCFRDGSCIVEWEGGCYDQGGFYQGDNTDCASILCPMGLMTTFQGGNGHAGSMFDLTVLNDVTIVGFDYLSASTAAPSQQQIEIYFVTDRSTFVGKEENAALWTLHETVTVSRQPSPTTEPDPTHVPLWVPLELNAGETIGIYFTRNSAMATTNIRYTNGPLGAFFTPDLIFEDRGVGKAYPFGSTFNPRVWNGVIYYIAGDPPCYADCDVNGELNINDFLCFIDEFAGAQTLPPSQQQAHYVNCTGATAEPYLTVNDFLCFIDKFAQGCP